MSPFIGEETEVQRLKCVPAFTASTGQLQLDPKHYGSRVQALDRCTTTLHFFSAFSPTSNLYLPVCSLLPFLLQFTTLSGLASINPAVFHLPQPRLSRPPVSSSPASIPWSIVTPTPLHKTLAPFSRCQSAWLNPGKFSSPAALPQPCKSVLTLHS